jgi:hypothetical protein
MITRTRIGFSLLVLVIGIMILIIGYYAIRTRHAATTAISEQSRFGYLWSSEKLSISTIQRTSMPSADDRRSIENLYRQAVIAYLQGDYERVTDGLASVSIDRAILASESRFRRIRLAETYKGRKLSDIDNNPDIKITFYHQVPYSYAHRIVNLMRNDEADTKAVLERTVFFESKVGQRYFLEAAYRESDGSWRLLAVPLHIFEGILDNSW